VTYVVSYFDASTVNESTVSRTLRPPFWYNTRW